MSRRLYSRLLKSRYVFKGFISAAHDKFTNVPNQTTVNMKKVELPVKQIVSGKKIKPSGTLVNPASLEYYYQFANVEKLAARDSKL